MINPLSDEIYQKRSVDKNFGIRGTYFRDQTAIIHSMPFRRLKNKTQVFFAPKNDHVCTRIEHVMHVASIASAICKGLNKSIKCDWNLDSELAYAIGLGHDLGHTPFGHFGESEINKKLKNFNIKDEFMHEVNGYRVVEYLANDGLGLNLTYAVKDGIICHNGESFERCLKPSNQEKKLEEIKDRKYIPCSYEGCIVRLSDKIAYLGRDIEDAITANFIKLDDVPINILKEIGSKNGEIINTFVEDVINYSEDKDEVGFSPRIHELMLELKKFNTDNIYNHERIINYKKMGGKIISMLFDHLLDLYNKYEKDFEAYKSSSIILDKQFGKYLVKMSLFYNKTNDANYKIITDYISGMTDLYALDCIKQITIPEPIEFFDDLRT